VKVYYAHCQAIYDTKQETRDVNLLNQLGFEVLNPNESPHSLMAQVIKTRGENVMTYFEGLVEGCDVLAFRALPDGRIPAGVAKEIEVAKTNHKMIIELPSRIAGRSIGVEETREYLAEIGQR